MADAIEILDSLVSMIEREVKKLQAASEGEKGLNLSQANLLIRYMDALVRVTKTPVADKNRLESLPTAELEQLLKDVYEKKPK